MARQETYNILDLDEEVDEDRNAETQYAPFSNMLSATRLITSLLEARNGSSIAQDQSSAYAVMGGFSMQLRGGRRSTRDVDMVTSLTMKGVWDAITGQMRIIIPASRLVSGIIKIFVKTGAPHDSCAETHNIEIDIMQAGFRGSPSKLSIENIERLGPFDLFGSSVSLVVVSIPQMMRIKIGCCLSREEMRDFEDVKYMIRTYGKDVRKAIDDGIVDVEELKEVLADERLGNDEVRRALLGVACGDG